jgi:hypothetical protein
MGSTLCGGSFGPSENPIDPEIGKNGRMKFVSKHFC